MADSLPSSIMFLSWLSLCVATCILTCSLMDLGMLSLWVNPSCAVATIVYHMTLLVFTHTRPGKAAVFCVSSIAFAYLLTVAWLAAFAIMTLIQCGGRKDLHLAGVVIHVPSHTITTQQFQFMLTPLEFAIMGDLAVRVTILRRGMWKPIEDL